MISFGLLFFCGTGISSALSQQKAYADGLTQENLPPASIGDRQASLFIKINPPILTTETKQDSFLQLRLFDARNNATIKFTTFIISITKGTDPKAAPLLTDAFLTENGLLTLKIQPQEGPVSVAATREDFLNAWKADPGGTINIKGPVLLEGGLYHFHIELLTIDNVRNLFASGDSPTYDTYLSVGDVLSQNVQFEGKTYPTTLISYYDKVKDFSFDANSKKYSWSMPFDWDPKRLETAANVFVHEEIKVPKSFAGVGDAAAYDATVNGKPIGGRMLAIDPFSSETEQILHFLINKNDILDMAKNPPSNSEMTFSFAPASNSTEKTSGEIATDQGGIHVMLSWQPSQLDSSTDAKLTMQFVDAFAGSKLTDDIRYDIRILDNGGNQVIAKTDQIAKGGVGEQTVKFPSNDNYRIEVAVKAVEKQGQTPDLTRSGVARGAVIVPEFPFSVAAVLTALAMSAVIIARFRSRNLNLRS